MAFLFPHDRIDRQQSNEFEIFDNDPMCGEWKLISLSLVSSDTKVLKLGFLVERTSGEKKITAGEEDSVSSYEKLSSPPVN